MPATPRTDGMQEVATRAQLTALARNLNVRDDWHEPDERGVSARVVGNHLDNAMGPTVSDHGGEFNVVITQENDEGVPEDVAVVNLATLLAWASHSGR